MGTSKALNRIEQLENKIGGLRAKIARSQAELQASYEALRHAEHEDSAKARLEAKRLGDEVSALQLDNQNSSVELGQAEILLVELKARAALLQSRVAENESAATALEKIRPHLQTVVDLWPAIFATLSPALQRATYDQAGGVRSLLQTANDQRAKLSTARDELTAFLN